MPIVCKKQPDSLSSICKNAFKTANLAIENKKAVISLHSLMIHRSTATCMDFETRQWSVHYECFLIFQNNKHRSLQIRKKAPQGRQTPDKSLSGHLPRGTSVEQFVPFLQKIKQIFIRESASYAHVSPISEINRIFFEYTDKSRELCR